MRNGNEQIAGGNWGYEVGEDSVQILKCEAEIRQGKVEGRKQKNAIGK